MSINRVVISGNLVADPKATTTAKGTNVLAFTVAVNDSRKNAAGQYEDVASFIDCKMFGTRASALSGIMVKGMHVEIDGKLSQSKWKNDQGETRSKVEILVDNVDLSGNRKQINTAQIADDIPF